MSIRALLEMLAIMLIAIAIGVTMLVRSQEEECFNPPLCNVDGGP